VCATFGMAPEQICFQSFRQAANVMQEADPASRILHAEDTGFVPLMYKIEAWLNAHIISRVDPRFCLRWANLRQRDEQQELTSIQERMNLGLLSINAALRERGESEIKDPLDLELYRMIEERCERQWPALGADRHERQRLARQVYEHYGGKYARWPDAPGMPAVVQQLYMQEVGPYLSPGPDGGAGMMPPGMPGMPPGEEQPFGLGEGGENQAPDANLGNGSLQGPAGASPTPNSELLSGFLPPELQKAIEDDPRLLCNIQDRLTEWQKSIDAHLAGLDRGDHR